MFWKLNNIVVPPDVIFTIPWINLPVTNTLLCTWLVILALAVFAYLATRRRDLVPRGLQNLVEWGVESLQKLVEGVSGKTKGKRFFPLVATLFIFILFSNLVDVLPGVDTIGTVEGATNPPNVLGFIHLLFGDNSNKLIPWFRPPTSDLNLTFAMAIVVVIVCQIIGFVALGARPHLSKYFKFKELFTKPFGGIEFFVGIIEIVTELSRILSFAFRLFGNIFAGSAVLAVFGFLTAGLANVIFIPLELFVAFVQALVFSLLTLVFLEMASTGHNHEHEEVEAGAEYQQNEGRQLAATH